MNEGIDRLERYDYAGAHTVFARLAEVYPQWEAAHVNRGISALNLQNEYLAIAEQAFARALVLNPRCLQALVCRGVLYKHTNRIDDMLRDYDAAAKIDPNDAHILFHRAVAWLEKGKTAEARLDLEKAARLQPSLAAAHYRLYFLLRTENPGAATASLERFKALTAADVVTRVDLKYGECGKYSLAIRGTAPPGWKSPVPPWSPGATLAFGAPQQITQRAAAAGNLPGGRPRSPAVAAGDLDGDGRLELVFCGEPGEDNVPGVAIYTPGDASAWKLSSRHALADAEACAIGDLDGDLDVDVLVAGPGWLRLLANDGAGKFTVAELRAEGTDFVGSPLRLTLIDADSDWDLDIVCLRLLVAADGKVSSRVELINNNRDGTYRDIAGVARIGPFDFPAAEMIVSDLDDDIDADLLVFDGLSGAMHAFVNDRIWAYRPVPPSPTSPRAPGLVASTGGDFDGDLDLDLVLFSGDSLRFWRNDGGCVFAEDTAFSARLGGSGGNAGVLADWQGALQASLVVLGARGAPGGAVFVSSPTAANAQPLNLVGAAENVARTAIAVVAAEGRGPELIVYDTIKGGHSFPLPPSASWFVLDLEGPQKPTPQKERANVAGVGATVEVVSGLKRARFWLDGGSGSAGRHSPRGFCGLAGAAGADYVRILWPDSILQSEQGLAPGKRHRLKQIERKPSSCPILFAWTGERHDFVADFLGVGGLGYFELPGVYSHPDPSEYVLLPEIKPRDGYYCLDVLEPLEECTYLDEVKLTVVEHPSHVTVLPDEMFAVRGPRPGFRLLAFESASFAVAASDSAGRDVTTALREIDRKYAYRVDRDPRFPGLARDTHRIELDFGEQIETLRAKNPHARPWLFLHGFIEYGYSTSNFAAWQANATFRAPSVHVEREGKWVVLREEWGFPAGYPRHMAVDLSSLLRAGDRKLRVETNLEICWDQAFLADASCTDFSATDLAFDMAELGFRGYPREISPDGEQPKIYVYGDFEPDAQFKPFPGRYTRHGDVRPLLGAADDQLALLGPGDGLELKVRADRLPPLAAGRRRTFFLKALGYCKDMDLYTAHPDQIEPLPFRAMSGYPFSADEAAAAAAAQAAYREEWNTRVR